MLLEDFAQLFLGRAAADDEEPGGVVEFEEARDGLGEVRQVFSGARRPHVPDDECLGGQFELAPARAPSPLAKASVSMPVGTTGDRNLDAAAA